MTIANPISGKVDFNSTATAAELNAVGVACASAVDAVGGGTITPSAIINFNGAGAAFGTDAGVGLVTARLTGAFTCAGSVGRIVTRLDITTLGNADADITIAKDRWRTTSTALTADRVYTIRHTLAGAIPVAGDVVRLTRVGVGAFTLTVSREDATPIWRCATGSRGWALFVYDGTSWATAEWESTNTTLVLTA